jgi:hypothetical protein
MKPGFSEWLIEKSVYTTEKQVGDCVSRVRRVERAFSEYDVDIDAEFDKDGGRVVLKCITRNGHNPERKIYPRLDLPYGSREQLGVIANAMKKYYLFRALSEKKHLDFISSDQMTKHIYNNYFAKEEA